MVPAAVTVKGRPSVAEVTSDGVRSPSAVCPHRGHESTCPAPPSSSQIYRQFPGRQGRIEPDPAEVPTLPPTPRIAPASKEYDMIVLGLVLLVVGFLLHISILTTLGIILLVIGAVLAILGGTGRMVGGRRHWY
jgi:Family of unknown function (DUF6131)